MSPLQMLQEAGRICCDASTFEAVGRMEKRSKMDGIESARVRWAFGPDGEYRFEYGPNITVIHDMKYVAVKASEKWVSIIDKRPAQPRQAPHNRYPGDVIMVTGMSAGMENLMSMLRSMGSSWMDPLPDPQFDFVGEESVNGHKCIKLLASDPSGGNMTTTIWIDFALGVMRKWTSGDREFYKSACYDTIRINPPLARREFEIPSEAIKEPVPKAYGPH